MSQPAARLTDMHVCPVADGPKPHVGGPVLGQGSPNVLIGGLPAATVGDMCACTGPTDIIVQGSTNVLIGGKPAARMGDITAHGGTIVAGCMTVLIGTAAGGGGAAQPSANTQKQYDQPTAAEAKKAINTRHLNESARNQETYADRIRKDDFTAQYELKDEKGLPLPGVPYEITMNDGKMFSGQTDQQGKTQSIQAYTVGNGIVRFTKQ